jgi:ankyrin repeat protein
MKRLIAFLCIIMNCNPEAETQSVYELFEKAITTNNQHKLIEILNTEGFDIDEARRFGNVDFFQNVKDEQIIIDLIEYNYFDELNINEKNGLLLHMADKGFLRVIQHFLPGMDLNTILDDGGLSLLHRGGIQGNVELGRLLIEYGIDVSLKDEYGTEAISYYAGMTNDLSFIELLVNEGANIESEVRGGNTSLFMSLLARDVQMSKYFLSKGARSNIVNDFGQVPIVLAASLGDIELIEYFLSTGVDINTTAGEGNTPLHTAVQSKDKDMVSYLLENGADPKIRTTDGYTALDYAEFSGSTAIVEIIEASLKENK